MRGLMMDRPLMISQIIEYAAASYPEQEIVSRTPEGGLHRYNYEDAAKRSRQLANALKSLGVQAGDRIATVAWNTYRHLELYYAVSGIGAICHTINPRLPVEQFGYIVNHAKDQYIFLDLTFVPLLEKLQGLFEGVKGYVVMTDRAHMPETSLPNVMCYEELVGEQSDEMAWPEFDEHTASSLCYTSGTTGNPKGCVHTHHSAMATTVYCSVWGNAQHDSVQLVSVPMFHVTGMQVCMNGAIYIGGTQVVMTRWDRKVAAQLIQDHRITGWRNISTMVVDLLSEPTIDDYDLSSLQGIGGGGAAMPAAVAAKLQAKTGLQYAEGYGLSETIAATHINPSEKPKKQCLGIPVFDVDSRVIDVDTGKEMGVGEVGEIISRGPQIFQGYWNRPLETQKAFIEIDGERFFRTGDMGYYDEEGYFFIVDRVKRMINASGFKVWPAEVESLMYRHPAIQESCVISAPHERRGETVKACVVLAADHKGKVSEDEIIAWCKEQMAAYKVPQIVEFRDELPRSPTGKVMWRAMQEEEWADQQQQA